MATLAVLCFPPVAAAQDVPARTVVLDVENGATDPLAEAIASVPETEVKRQDWFIQQLRKRKMKAKKIMDRAEDLRWLMSAAGISYIVVLQDGGDAWEGSVYDESGEPVREWESPNDGAVDDSTVEIAKNEFSELRGFGAGEESDEIVFAEPEPADAQPAPEPEETEPPAKKAPREAAETPAFAVGLAGRLFKRELSIVGDNGATLGYQSAFYPGASLDIDIFPSALALGPGLLGFYLEADVGFDSVSAADESIAILQLEAEGGLGLSVPGESRLRFQLGARHSRFTLAVNDVFPSLSETFFLFGAHATHPLGAVDLVTGLDVIPFSLYGQGGDLFGAGGRSFGFAGDLGVLFGVGPVAVKVGARARLTRTIFAGEGTLDFRDSSGFALVWGPEVGVTWPN